MREEKKLGRTFKNKLECQRKEQETTAKLKVTMLISPIVFPNGIVLES